jgi:hypothetical protein
MEKLATWEAGAADPLPYIIVAVFTYTAIIKL